MATQTPAKQLYDLLVSRNFDLELLDSSGRPSSNPAETEIFSFDYRTESGNDYGTVVIMLGSENDMEIYFGDNVGRGMEGEDKKEWFDFLYQLRMFAKRNLMTFGLKNLNRLRYSMQGQAAIKEGLFESWSGKRDVSYNAGPNESRLMIRHKRALGEDEARYRCVESLFIETAEGERYKLPFKNLTAGKAMLEHVRNGGNPYDIRGQHIVEMVNELNVLSRFRRASHGKIFEQDTAALVEQTNAYYESARRTLKSLTTRTGYKNYFESWNPTEITEQEVVIEGLKHLFVTQTLDQRIEEALPILARIQQQGTEMKEANIFEAWVNQLLEGTWALPDTPGKKADLVELLSKELPVGTDATNATEQLYDLLGDDVLFNQLEDLAERDANADARQIILNRMQELSDNPAVATVLAELNVDIDTPTEVDAEVDVEKSVDETAQPGVTADFSLEEGRMKQLATDLDELGDSEFWDKYGRTKADVREKLGEDQLNEFLPLVGAVLGRSLAGAGANALTRAAAGAAGHAIGGEIEDALDQEEVDEAGIPGNLPAGQVPGKEKLLKTPASAAERAMAKIKDMARGMSGDKDVETFGSLKEQGEEEMDEQGAACTTGNPTLETTDLTRLKTLSGILVK